jgi:hypothetical protein
MPHDWRAALLAMCLALSVGPSCAGSSSDVTSPPTGNNPPPEPPTPPPPPPPPAPPPPGEPGPPPSPPPGPPIPNPAGLGSGARVLFIGNSLTYANDLPAQVLAMATAEGLNWDVQTELLSGASLEDHWQRGSAQARIQSGHWDAVVLQQGPSSLPESRVNLRQWVAQFDGLVRAAGGRSALYMVWPELTRFSWFDRVRDSYALAARDVSGWFLPAGESWRAAWRDDPSLALYGGDGFHPTVAGSYAAALTIFAGLSGRSPLGLPAAATVDPATAERLQQAAQEALEQYGDYGPVNAP